MKRKKKAQKQPGKSTALIPRTLGKLPQANGAIDALVAAGTKALGFRPRVDKDYSIGLARRQNIYWLQFKDKNSGTVSWKPYIDHAGLVDVLEQRGYKSMITKRLPAVPCQQAGCINAKPTDWQQQCECTIVLKNGKTATTGGDSCIHNTNGPGKKAPARMAETRAIGRCIRRVCNVQAVALVELDAIDHAQVWKNGERILSSSEVEGVINATFTDETAQGAQATGTQAAATPLKPVKEEPAVSKEWTASSRKLHALLWKMKINPEGFHVYMKTTAAETGTVVDSVREFEPAILERFFEMMLKLRDSGNESKMLEFRAWCERNAPKKN